MFTDILITLFGHLYNFLFLGQIHSISTNFHHGKRVDSGVVPKPSVLIVNDGIERPRRNFRQSNAYPVFLIPRQRETQKATVSVINAAGEILLRQGMRTIDKLCRQQDGNRQQKEDNGQEETEELPPARRLIAHPPRKHQRISSIPEVPTALRAGSYIASPWGAGAVNRPRVAALNL